MQSNQPPLIPLTRAERARRWAEQNPERARKKWREDKYRQRYGDYKLKDHCEFFDCRGKSENLIPHHIYFKDCPACMPRTPKNGKGYRGGVCTREDHIATVCVSCHNRIHAKGSKINKVGPEIAYDWRMQKELKYQERHLADIAAD